MSDEASQKPIPPWVHVALALLLCGALANGFFLLTNPEKHGGSFVFILAILFNHIALYYIRPGCAGCILQAVALAGMVYGTWDAIWKLTA